MIFLNIHIRHTKDAKKNLEALPLEGPTQQQLLPSRRGELLYI